MSQSIRIALIEPHEPDARWFAMSLAETEILADFVWYETPLKALARWDAVRPHYDVMVVSDLLPMLTLQEFLSEAMVLVPEAVFCVATEPGVLVERVPNVQYVDKPLSAERLRSILLRGRTAAA